MSSVHKIKPIRSTGVRVRKTYRLYKPELRNDFNKRCGYCDDDDSFLGGSRHFHVDHFAPKAKFQGNHPEIVYEYTNLIYSCPYCNGSKGDDWVSDDPKVSYVDDEGYVDPCHDDYDIHLARDGSGCIKPQSKLGEYMHRELKLDLCRHELIWKIGQLESNIDKIEAASKTDISLLPLYQKLKELRDLLES